MVVYATDKQSLKKAFDSKADEIIVTGKLAKKLKKVQALKKASPAALAIAGGAIAAAVPTIIAATATAPATAGTSYLLALPAIAAETTAVATTLSVSTSVAVSIIILAASIGVSLLISLFKDYCPEVIIKHGKTEIHFRFKK